VCVSGLADRQGLQGGMSADPLHFLWGEFELELQFFARNATHALAPDSCKQADPAAIRRHNVQQESVGLQLNLSASAAMD